MLVNNTKSKIIVGRFHVMPGDVLPDLPMTDNEKLGVEKFKKFGYLIEQNVEKAEEAVAPAVESAPVVEAAPKEEAHEEVKKAAEPAQAKTEETKATKKK